MKHDGTIILIDDNTAELRLCEEAIKSGGISNPIILLENGVTAFEYIKENCQKVFLIICDINMPGMSGMELLEKINDNYELKMQAVPFIFLSNSDNLTEVEHAYSLSAQGYFLKPSSLRDLIEIFKAVITYWSMAKIPRDVLYQ